MMNLKGTIQKIKVVHLSEHPLVYFRLDNVHCLIANHALKFLADVTIGSTVSLTGGYNTRKQFVVKKYSVLGKPQIVIEFESSLYPPKHV